MSKRSRARASRETRAIPSKWLHPLAVASLLVLFSVLYVATLHPGVAEGDSAELQWAGPEWAICHSPGYAIEVAALHLFTALPLGGTAAWRANLMLAVLGITGVLLLYGTVRRVTDNVLAGWVAAATLGLTTVYWTFSLVTEAYVFGGAFIALSMYSAARFEGGARLRWFLLSALSLGVVITERPSELTLLPAFLILWLGAGGREILRPRKVLAAAFALLLPFGVAVALNVAKDNPEREVAQNDFVRTQIPGVDLSGEVTYPYTTDRDLLPRVLAAVNHMSGRKWAWRVRPVNIGLNFKEFMWLVSGLGAWGNRFAPAGQHDPMLEGGMSLGPIGLLAALVGALAWRRRRVWVLHALALAAGNLVFVLLYGAFDTMTFTVPAWIALAFLAGLGCDALQAGAKTPALRRLAGGAAILLIPVILLSVNYRYVSLRTAGDRHLVEWRQGILQCDWPRNSVLLMTYWPAMTFRYMLEVEAGRRDILIVHAESKSLDTAARYFEALGRPVFGMGNQFRLTGDMRRNAVRTPEAIRKTGMLYLGG
ncbi:MAG TPA: DUF2723 domain-containing protein [Candidatus Saccharimonadales bacterium]|nr:DUF2723 domain-containing protein [Candidatus Saccharimonadales bacterium]